MAPLHLGLLTLDRAGQYITEARYIQAMVEDLAMQLTPREFDKLLIHMLADVALKRNAKGIKLNYPLTPLSSSDIIFSST